LRLYRDVWVIATAVMVTVGFWAALVIGTVPGVLGLFVSFGMLAVLVGFILMKDDRPGVRGRAIGAGLAVSASLVATGGLVGVLGPEAIWLVVAAGLSSPWTLQWCVRLVRRSAPKPPPVPAQRMPEPDLECISEAMAATTSAVLTDPDPISRMDDHALCLAWRRSFVALQRSRSLSTRMSIVELRQLYLDELERRNPAGLSAWLESGARAAGDPSRYILLH
jgi:hypothetical protein